MSVTIINHCKKTYKPNPEKTIFHILEQIPEKFLIGLYEIRVFDSRPSKALRKSCVCKTISSQHSIIELYMDDPVLSGFPFFSRLLLNLVFLYAINDHIKNYLHHHSNDDEILTYNLSRVNLNWGYFGIWSPLMSVFKLGSYLTIRIRILQKLWSHAANRIIEKHR